MSLLQQFWHWLNFLLPALGTGAIAALLSKLLWRHALRHVSWLRLAAWAVLAGETAYVFGLILTGRDGAMASYGVMVLAIAAAIWLAGFGPLRRGPA
jgi:hypothetical protein